MRLFAGVLTLAILVFDVTLGDRLDCGFDKYRNFTTGVCNPCNCDPEGTGVEGYCNQFGRCECKVINREKRFNF